MDRVRTRVERCDLEPHPRLLERPLVAEGRRGKRRDRRHRRRRRRGHTQDAGEAERDDTERGLEANALPKAGNDGRSRLSPAERAREPRRHPSLVPGREREHRREHHELRDEPPPVRRAPQLAPGAEVEPSEEEPAHREEPHCQDREPGEGRDREREAWNVRARSAGRARPPEHGREGHESARPGRDPEQVEHLRRERQPAPLAGRRAVGHESADHHEERGHDEPGAAAWCGGQEQSRRGARAAHSERARRARAAWRGASSARTSSSARPQARAPGARGRASRRPPPRYLPHPPARGSIELAQDRAPGCQRGRPGAARRPARPATGRAVSTLLRSGPWDRIAPRGRRSRP